MYNILFNIIGKSLSTARNVYRDTFSNLSLEIDFQNLLSKLVTPSRIEKGFGHFVIDFARSDRLPLTIHYTHVACH